MVRGEVRRITGMAVVRGAAVAFGRATAAFGRAAAAVRRAVAAVRTLAVVLSVTACGPAAADGLRLVVPEMRLVVGEMIPVTVRGEYTRLITLQTLTFPSSDGYDWMQLARDQWRDEMIDGRSVKVFERRIAVFPRRPGPLVIGPVTHHLTLVGDNGGRDVVDVAAPPVTLTIAPFPAAGTPLAAASLTVEDRLSAAPGALRDGETLVRRVEIRAEATLPHLLPPRPRMREPWLITFAAPETRETRPTPDGPVTTIVWEWHLRPKTGEPGVLPAVAIPWFDTIARTIRTAEIPAIPFGYASFGDNRSGADALPADQRHLGLAALAAGLAAGLALAFAGLSGRRRDDLRRRLLRLSPYDPTRRAVLRAARSGDLAALRRAAETHLRRRRTLGLPVTGDETAALDAVLYGRDAERTVDAGTLARGVLGRG